MPKATKIPRMIDWFTQTVLRWKDLKRWHWHDPEVICQFIRLFPAVRFELDYDNMWRTRFEEGRRRAKPDAAKIFDVMEGTVET